jgi:hypothetical protein
MNMSRKLSITWHGWKQARTPEFRRDCIATIGSGTPAAPSTEAYAAAILMLRSWTAATLTQKKGQKLSLSCTKEGNSPELDTFINSHTVYIDKIWSNALGRK